MAEKYSVSPSWVRRLKQRKREDGRTEPRPSRNKRVPKLAGHADRIRELIAATPDLTLAELRDRLGVAVALATLWAAVAKLGLTVKKKSSPRPSRPSIDRSAASIAPRSSPEQRSRPGLMMTTARTVGSSSGVGSGSAGGVGRSSHSTTRAPGAIGSWVIGSTGMVIDRTAPAASSASKGGGVPSGQGSSKV